MRFRFNLQSKVAKRRGFTLIEVVVALTILVIIIASTMSLLASSYSSLRDSEMRGIAKNIATYAVEYIRSRNVTSDNNFINTSDWYDETKKPDGKFPGLVDVNGNPLCSNGSIGSTQGESNATNCINTHPVLSGAIYSLDNSAAFYYSLQGYVSLQENPSSGTFPNHSAEDANLYIDKKDYYYHNIDVSSYNANHVHTVNCLVFRFPFDASDTNSAIKSFTAGPNYLPMVYTDDPTKADYNDNNPDYSPFYTNDIGLKKRTQDYRGFRILTTIVARTNQEDPDNPGQPAPNAHAQYFDVKVTVFWMAGKQEHSYTLQTQIVTYGGT